jgi:hypothetical protein
LLVAADPLECMAAFCDATFAERTATTPELRHCAGTGLCCWCLYFSYGQCCCKHYDSLNDGYVILRMCLKSITAYENQRKQRSLPRLRLRMFSAEGRPASYSPILSYYQAASGNSRFQKVPLLRACCVGACCVGVTMLPAKVPKLL